MAAVVIDTDVSSLLLRRRFTGPLAGKVASMDACVSFVTVGELWNWAELHRWGRRSRVELAEFLIRVVILDGTESIGRRWGEMVASAQRRGRVPPINDSWIAASCLARGLPLGTLNTKDFTDPADRFCMRAHVIRELRKASRSAAICALALTSACYGL